MKRSQFVVMILVAAVSGLIGGGLTNWLFRPDSAFAENAMLSMSDKKKTSGPKKVISAKEFHLVDDDRQVLAVLGVEENNETGKQVGLTIFDEKGDKRTRLYGAKWGAALDIFDAAGNHRFHAGEKAPGGQMSNASVFLADTTGKPVIKCELAALGGMFAQCTDPKGRGLVVSAPSMKPKPYVSLKGGPGADNVLWTAP